MDCKNKILNFIHFFSNTFQLNNFAYHIYGLYPHPMKQQHLSFKRTTLYTHIPLTYLCTGSNWFFVWQCDTSCVECPIKLLNIFCTLLKSPNRKTRHLNKTKMQNIYVKIN